MTNSGPSFNDIFPNELIREILGKLPGRQRKSAMRVSLTWQFLVNSFGAKNTLEEEFPFLHTEEEREALNCNECARLVEKQKKIYTYLADLFRLPKEYLQREQLNTLVAKKFEDPNLNLNLDQKIFLEKFACASDVSNNITKEYQNKSIALMARIGNLKKLEKAVFDIREKTRQEMMFAPEPKDDSGEEWTAVGTLSKEDYHALLISAVDGDQRECLAYLMQCIKEKMKERKVATFKNDVVQRVAEKGALECLEYLMDACGQETTWGDYETAMLEVADHYKQVDFVNYLKKRNAPKQQPEKPADEEGKVVENKRIGWQCRIM